MATASKTAIVEHSESTTAGEVDVDIAGRLAHSMSALFRSSARVKAKLAPDGQPADWGSFYPLSLLWDDGPMRLSALAEAMHVDPSTISRQVSHLVETGSVERRADPTDGRACVLACTDRGRALIQRHRRARDEFVAGLVADWSAQDRATLADLMERFSTELNSNLPHIEASSRMENS